MNQYVIYDDYAEVILTDTDGNECGRAKISLDMTNLCKMYHWCKHTKGYAISSDGILMHRLIMGMPDEPIDHIDQDKLDNRTHMLKLTTNQLNMYNTKLYSSNTSGYKGVSWHSQKHKWRARITIDGHEKHLGLFDTPEEAYEARCKYEKDMIRRD